MLVSFTHPQYLFLLVLLPIIVFLHFMLLKIKRPDAVRFANFEAIARIRGIDLYSKNIAIVLITSVIATLIILSVSGLQVQRDIVSSTHSFVIAIDTSESMEAVDVSPSRIGAAKNTAQNFVDSSPAGTNIAVLSFSGSAFLEQTLTSDKTLAKNALQNIELSSIGGTDPAEAVISATNVLALEEARSIILLSDGRINVGNMDEALDYALRNNVIIHTIGIGTIEGGETSFGVSRLEEASLQSAAYTTGGTYTRVASESDLQNALDQILEYKVKKVSFDLSRQTLIVALILLIIQYILSNTRYKTFP